MTFNASPLAIYSVPALEWSTAERRSSRDGLWSDRGILRLCLQELQAHDYGASARDHHSVVSLDGIRQKCEAL